MNTRRHLSWLWPVSGLASLLILWAGVVAIFHIRPFIVPSPLSVFHAIGVNWGILLRNLAPTATEAVSGFVIGNSIGIILAIIFVHSDLLRRMYFPVAVLFNTIPIIALSPVLILIFGLSTVSKILIAAIICLFPTLVNMIRGFEAVSQSELELMKIMSASKFETFFILRLPRSLPFLFSALKITCTTCVIGALVSEWIGADRGIGVLIIQSTFDYRTELLYAAITMSSALALSLFGLVTYLEHLILRSRGA